MYVRFEWDDQKNASNLKKHGVDFETAARAFLDPHLVIIVDRVVDGETRWRTIGEVDGGSLLLVIHLYGDDEEDEIEVVRIISARETTPQERRRYESNL